MIGYTAKQAERMKYRIDLRVAEIEDAMLNLRTVVTDVDWHTVPVPGPDNVLEEVREIADHLRSVVDRRTVRPRAL